MATIAVTVEFKIMEGDQEWDYALRRHHVAATGGEQAMVDLCRRTFKAKLERGKPGNFSAMALVNGNEVARLDKLNKQDVRKLEDFTIDEYKKLRK